MAIDYYSKYLKYKSKYLELKAQMGSGPNDITNACDDCPCDEYEPIFTIRDDGVKVYSYDKCGNSICGHSKFRHSRKVYKVNTTIVDYKSQLKANKSQKYW